MIVKRFYDDALAQASYLVGCPGSGEACIIDPNRDTSQYLNAAALEGLRITAVTETHIHADYLSGARELSNLAGSKLYLSDEGDADWKYGYAHEQNVVPVRHGDSIRVGAARLDVLHTPGHTPEHVSFLLTDEAASQVPLGAFTGDFVFVGDVGRPDLLESAAGVKGTMEPGARALFRSVQEFAKFPDHLLIWPGHGAGSACGKSLGGVPVSSLGYERLANWAFRAQSEEGFVREVLAGQPDPPKYFAQMKLRNQSGPDFLGGTGLPPRHGDPGQLKRLAETGNVLDIRPSAVALGAHVPGSVHVPLNRSFSTWAGWFVPYDQDIWLIADNEADVLIAVHDLAMIGLDHVAGWFGPESTEGISEHIEEIAAADAPGKFVLDVRSKQEWDAGHRSDAHHIPMGRLPERLRDLPNDRCIAVHCQKGGRSPVAMTILRKHGFKNLAHISEGYVSDCVTAPSIR